MILAQGSLNIESLDKEYQINTNQFVLINRKIFHKLCSNSDDTIILEFEINMPNKNDLIRYKDNYDRANTNYESGDNIINLNNDAKIEEAKSKYEYFEYDLNDLQVFFKKSNINFITGKFEDNKNIKENNIILILEGKINIDGIYIDTGSIFYGSKILNKNIIYITKTFKYFIYNEITSEQSASTKKLCKGNKDPLTNGHSSVLAENESN